jgi:hypothetical protein
MQTRWRTAFPTEAELASRAKIDRELKLLRELAKQRPAIRSILKVSAKPNEAEPIGVKTQTYQAASD